MDNNLLCISISLKVKKFNIRCIHFLLNQAFFDKVVVDMLCEAKRDCVILKSTCILNIQQLKFLSLRQLKGINVIQSFVA